jgi:crotonobetainyl-CoA:carnitine CoA-transferase CaiB-like acyl-CoA transferase
MLLADMGADVVKIEDPFKGDYARFYQPFVGSMGAMFAGINRNKRSVALNLKAPAGLSALRKLLEGADVLLESFRPGVLARLGLGFDVLARDFPSLIVCSISGFGQTGPLAKEAGHDVTYLARAGVLATNGVDKGPLVIPGFQLADVAGGALYATSAVLAALFKRERGGEAAHIDVSMTEGALSFNLPLLARLSAGKTFEGPATDLLDGGIPCYRIYETSDGGFMALGALEPKFWMAFCQAAGCEELLGDGLVMGSRAREAQDKLSVIFKSRTRDEWAALLEGVDCCCEPVRRPDEVLDDPLFTSRDVFFTLDAPSETLVQTATPLTPADRSTFTPPPKLGEHTREVLAEVGVPLDEIENLVSSGNARA